VSAPKIMGVNCRTYPSEHDYHGTTVKVVLVAGDIEDYAAYAGQGSDEWVAANGDKVHFEEACVHFPGGQLEKARYRP
jgi:hypothetical protein